MLRKVWILSLTVMVLGLSGCGSGSSADSLSWYDKIIPKHMGKPKLSNCVSKCQTHDCDPTAGQSMDSPCTSECHIKSGGSSIRDGWCHTATCPLVCS